MFISIKRIRSNKRSLEIQKKLIKSCVWSVALHGLETWTVGKNEENLQHRISRQRNNVPAQTYHK